MVDKERRFGRTVSHLGYGFPVGSLSALMYRVREFPLWTCARKLTYSTMRKQQLIYDQVQLCAA